MKADTPMKKGHQLCPIKQRCIFCGQTGEHLEDSMDKDCPGGLEFRVVLRLTPTGEHHWEYIPVYSD
jgi:hypothetical protein